jgi:hypothetical protein
MTTLEICKAIDSGNYTGPVTTEILGAVRWYSIGQGVRRVCDEHTKRAKEAHVRAAACRYHKLAETVLGAAGEMIYDGAYGDAPEIGSWEHKEAN